MKATPFNRPIAIRSELSTPEEREEKIKELTARGFVVKRLYERIKGHSDYVATGYSNQPLRRGTSTHRKVYGVVFDRE